MKTIHLKARHLEDLGIEIAFAHHNKLDDECKENARRLFELFSNEPEPEKHRYFIAYNHSGYDNSFGSGWLELTLEKPIRDTADLEHIKNLVIDKHGYKAVAITSWQRFED
jgi:hypothetical protein